MKSIFKIFIFVVAFFYAETSFCLTIVTSNYPAFDIASHVVGDKAKVKVLLKPGTDAHRYEPSPKDLGAIEECDLFYYTGGENDEWIERLLNSTSKNINTLSMLDSITPLSESEAFSHTFEAHNHHHDEAFDEHVWTSLKNDIVLIDDFAKKISAIDPKNADFYKKNAHDYVNKFVALDIEFTALIKNSKRQVLVFADRFPFLYFVHDYGLDYYAAFSGCAEDTEASPKTVASLIKKVIELKTPYVLCQEFSTEKLAKTVALETNTEVLTFNACHNISKKQYQDKVELIELLRQNFESLKKALN